MFGEFGGTNNARKANRKAGQTAFHPPTNHQPPQIKRVRVKNRYPKWNPDKCNQGQKPTVPWRLNLDPYPNSAQTFPRSEEEDEEEEEGEEGEEEEEQSDPSGDLTKGEEDSADSTEKSAWPLGHSAASKVPREIWEFSGTLQQLWEEAFYIYLQYWLAQDSCRIGNP